MNIAVIAVGSRGDVQPAIALAKGLNAAGHHVKIIAGSEAEGFVTKHGIDYAALPMNSVEVLNSGSGLDWMEAGSKPNPLHEINALKAIYDEYGLTVARCLMDEIRGSDLILTGVMSFAYTASIAETLGIPQLHTFLQPWLMTREGSSTMKAALPKRASVLNHMSGYLNEWGFWQMCKDTLLPFREELGLPPISLGQFRNLMRNTPALMGYSAHIAARPDDWNPQTYVTGYWFLDDEADYTPPEDLQAFLDAGEAPVYIGFGSMSQRNAQATTELMLDAVKQVNCRAIIAKGWAELSAKKIPDTVYMLDSVPHHWLFPKMAGIVHHGGAGTTSAALRAGVPSAIVPHIVDQPFWGRRIHEMGVGTEPIPRYQLTADSLAKAIWQLRKIKSLRRNALVLGQKIREEDGVKEAVAAIEGMFVRQEYTNNL